MPGPYKSITTLNIISDLFEQVVEEIQAAILESEVWESENAETYREMMCELSRQIGGLSRAVRGQSQSLERLFNAIPV